jgi:hypothetical protein
VAVVVVLQKMRELSQIEDQHQAAVALELLS